MIGWEGVVQVVLVLVLMVGHHSLKLNPANFFQGDGLVAKVKSHFSHRGNNLSKIDKVCRLAFPLGFLIFNAIYWIIYAV